MRLFVAIELPEDIRRQLVRVQDSLREVIDAKWVRAEQMHLTLKFLGETADEELPGVVEALKSVRFGAVELWTEGVVCFPPHGAVRIVAMGLGDRDDRCAMLAEEIDRVCHEVGFKLEGRKWKPHVTVGRVKSRVAGPARAAATSISVARREFFVDDFALIESRLDRSGPEYLRVAHFSAGE
jgi:RNA 2',3'-cyclic 3'-phosphodiesterase